jgi:Tfp pilus assembly protein PilX
MRSRIHSPHSSRNNQRGTVLILSVILLLLASVLTLFAVNTGLFEQRTSGNDVRLRLVRQVADSGIAQAMEYIKANPHFIDPNSKWQLCTAADTTFPCGAVTDSEKTHMYRYNDTGATVDVIGDGSVDAMDQRMIPMSGSLTNVNNTTTGGSDGYTVNYGVGAVLCRVKTTAPLVCATGSATPSSTYLVTLVSVARIPGEGARTTATKTAGGTSLLNNVPGAPPIVASGSIDLTGTLQIVTNPNAAGIDTPVSIWTRKDASKTGTPNTCFFDEFIRYGAKNNAPPVVFDGIITCDTCSCPNSGSLSYDASGNAQQEGIDILDVDGNTIASSCQTANKGANCDVQPGEFPCDLFNQIFGVQAWSDVDADGFCEHKLLTTYTNPNTGVDTTMGVDEAYLFENARLIIPSAATTSANLLKPGQSATCSALNSSAFGLIWDQTGCGVSSNGVVGAPSHPVMLVSDGSTTIQGNFYGMIFLRTTAGGGTLTPAGGYTMTATEINNGGNAQLSMNAGAAVYGSVVVQGIVNKANGTSAVIYNHDVLTNLAGEPSLNKLGGVPGSWTDRFRY